MTITTTRVAALIAAETVCEIEHTVLGTSDVQTRFGKFTGLPGGDAVEFTSVFTNGSADPHVIQDVSMIESLVELEPA